MGISESGGRRPSVDYRAGRDRGVLGAVIARFGACDRDQVERIEAGQTSDGNGSHVVLRRRRTANIGVNAYLARGTGVAKGVRGW